MVVCEICATAISREVFVGPDIKLIKTNELLSRRGKRPFTSGLVNRVIQCEGCGLMWLDPRMDKEELQRFYEEWYAGEFRGVRGDPEGRGKRGP